MIIVIQCGTLIANSHKQKKIKFHGCEINEKIGNDHFFNIVLNRR
jgi:hypothetical protein